ncbi:30S ribosomal protein S16 [Longimonas halophila]|uniref:Small ribosomal subunit protein bS16 n=1 Tax=Longimonas halophila TaxID=1469170 RepID=A0A2H3P0W9_9BACT|nr:30S ribosomal protein S16 [Longimonas halophila]
MSVKLRMRRMGRKKIPVFSIVATDSRNARDGRYIEDLGRYYPLEQPATVQVDEERVLYWLENGAQPSDTVRSLISKRGLMLHHHLKKKGKSPEQIAEAVDEHIQRLEEKGEDIKMTAEMRRAQAIEEERERAAELEEQRRKEEEERRKAEEEAKAKAEAEAKAAEEKAAAEAEEDADESDTADADAAEVEAADDADAAEATDEDAADESDDTPKSDA